MNVEEARDLFPVLKNGSPLYLQHGGMSPQTARAVDMVTRVVKVTAETLGTKGYQEDLTALREGLGRLHGIPADRVVLTRGTGHGISLAARGLEWKAGDNIVSARGEFPTNIFPWTALKKRYGVEVRVAEIPDGRITPDKIFPLCDSRTRVVALSWVQWWNGYRLDLTAFGDECRKRGILLVLDGIQGSGIMRADLDAAGVDVFSAGAHKWLLGPMGIGWAYISERAEEQLFPALLGGGTFPIVPGSSTDHFDIDEMEPGLKKYHESAISWLDAAAFLSGVQILEEFGQENAERRVIGLSEKLGEGLSSMGMEMLQPWPRRYEESSALISFRHPSLKAPDAQRMLAEAGVIARSYIAGNWLRFSPHFYNTDEEMDRALAAVAALDKTPVG